VFHSDNVSAADVAASLRIARCQLVALHDQHEALIRAGEVSVRVAEVRGLGDLGDHGEHYDGYERLVARDDIEAVKVPVGNAGELEVFCLWSPDGGAWIVVTRDERCVLELDDIGCVHVGWARFGAA
jgi:hypothetical protein